jgi:hypothetical protein
MIIHVAGGLEDRSNIEALDKKAVPGAGTLKAPAELGDQILCPAVGLPSLITSDKSRVKLHRVLMY